MRPDDSLARELQAFYQRMRREAEQIFPIHFAAEPGVAKGGVSGVVEGFYVLKGFRGRLVIIR